MVAKREVVQLLSSKEAAAILRVSEKWLQLNRKSSKRISYIQLGRKIYYEEQDLLDWIRQHKTKGQALK